MDPLRTLLPDLRTQALQAFEKAGWPTRRTEDWRYTRVDRIVEADLRPAPAERRPAAVSGLAVPPEWGRLVLVNGWYAPELSAAPAADVVRPLDGPVEHLGQLAGIEGHPFVALNTAWARSGLVVRVPRGVRLAAPLYVLHVAHAAEGEALAGYPRVLVVAEPGSEVHVVEHFVGDRPDAAETLTNAVTEVLVGDGAGVRYTRLQTEHPGAYHVGRVEVRLGRDARFRSHDVALGGRLARCELRVTFDGPGAEADLAGLFAAGEGQHQDAFTAIDHAVPHCRSNTLYKGLATAGRGVFTGSVRVGVGARGTRAEQHNPNLLLDTEAHIDTRPQLEINNDDVKCSHGATIGRLDADQLFALRSRGIDLSAARRMLTLAFAGEVVDGLPHEALIEPVRRTLDEKCPSSRP